VLARPWIWRSLVVRRGGTEGKRKKERRVPALPLRFRSVPRRPFSPILRNLVARKVIVAKRRCGIHTANTVSVC
jgi:hypothetical protein